MTAPGVLTTAERVARRRELRERLLARLEDDVKRIGRSIVCYEGRHEACVGHLRSNGGACLCEHHDLDEEVPA